MKLQHLRLKVAQLQADIDRQVVELDALRQELQGQCHHLDVIKSPYERGTFIDGDELRVCTVCGAWELGWYQYGSRLTATCDETQEGEALKIREELSRHSALDSRLGGGAACDHSVD